MTAALALLAVAAHAPGAAAPTPPGHSAHGEAFDDGPRQRARRMGGTGGVHLPVTAKGKDAQAFFDQGVGQLHGFWYWEAERSFRQVAALDPDCAMAYWGMAMANVHNKKRAGGFLRAAADRKGKASPREQRWVAAYAGYWLGTADDKDRRRDLVKALEDLALDFPDEVEARAFLLFQVWDNAGNGWPIGSRLAVDALAREVFAKAPLHPAHHYVIHLWDDEKPARALASAARCGPAAPGVAHMWHMPGHTYSKLKRYADAAWHQEASARTDHAYTMTDRVFPDQIHNYAHNNQWLAETYEFLGRPRDAVAVAKNLIELPRHPRFNTLGVNPDGSPLARNHGSSGEGRKRLLETLTRYELWADLVALAGTPYLDPTAVPAEQAARLRALGLAHFGAGNPKPGRDQIDALEALRTTLKAARVAAADEAEAKAKADKKPADAVAKAMADALRAHSGRLAPVEAAVAELRGLDALARGEKDQARELFARAGDIPKDRLARHYLALGDTDRAEKTAREDANGNETQVFRLANLADILRRCGKAPEAAAEFQKLRGVAADADLDVPVLRRLAPLAKELGLPADWRAKRAAAADVGDRPRLDSLGPLLWQPWPAPDFRLPCADGGDRGLADYRGKPVVVLGYLGSGCVHCVEQLDAFAPLADQFRGAGIEVVAVATDPLADVRRSADRGGKGKPLPFPVLADPGLSFFRAYRAYDDFEGKPLHGTFLVDGAGRVRWQGRGPRAVHGRGIRPRRGEAAALIRWPPERLTVGDGKAPGMGPRVGPLPAPAECSLTASRQGYTRPRRPR